MEYGCIAEKIGHSFSKDIHERLFDYKYDLCELSGEEFDSFMKNKNFRAINVTIPYKEKVIPYLDGMSDVAKKIGAVNTVVNKNGRLMGYNTDFLGLSLLITRNKIELKNKKVLILGSGGTSKTAMSVANTLGAKEVYRLSRTEKDGCITYSKAQEIHSDADVIINTTPVGMYPNIGVSPISLDLYSRISGVVDVVYNPLRSKLVCDAEERNIKAVGGLYMLVAQAAFAAEKFTEKSVDRDKIDAIYSDIMRKKLNVVLTGLPGAGKTTIGELLADSLGFDFIDTDEEIVKRQNMPIKQIFDNIGESGFRKIESEVIKELASIQGTVIATGGGAVLDKNNIELLRENGRIYFLDRDIDSIMPTSDRPLSSDREMLKKRYNERYPIYCQRCDKHILCKQNVEENMMYVKKDYYEFSCN